MVRTLKEKQKVKLRFKKLEIHEIIGLNSNSWNNFTIFLDNYTNTTLCLKFNHEADHDFLHKSLCARKNRRNLAKRIARSGRSPNSVDYVNALSFREKKICTYVTQMHFKSNLDTKINFLDIYHYFPFCNHQVPFVNLGYV